MRRPRRACGAVEEEARLVGRSSINNIVELDLSLEWEEKIKSLNERPLTVVFLTNKVPEKISESAMNDISEVATKQALRDLAKSQLEKYNESVDVTDSSDDDEYYVTTQKYEELEKKCHYLQLDMLNTKNDYDDKCEYIETKYYPISNIDGIMCQMINLKRRTNIIFS